MKIFKRLDKRRGTKTYYKYLINLPKKEIEDSGLLDKELKVKIVGKQIIIKEDNNM